MYRISLFQIWPELAGFVHSNPAGTGARSENLVQDKTTPQLRVSQISHLALSMISTLNDKS